MSFNEKESFVVKKEMYCRPDDPLAGEEGDNGDQVTDDPEHRLVVSFVPGKRTDEPTHLLAQDFKRRTGGRLMNLLTSDEHPVYKTAVFEADAVVWESPPTGRPGRPKKPVKVPPKKL